jgi:stage V sporulation protein G
MKITAVSMRVVDREKVKAFASITIDDEFVVHDLRIIEGQKGLFVAMPSRKLPNGEFRDVAHPIKPEVREMIQGIVLDEYEKRKASPEAYAEERPVKKPEAPPAEKPEAPPAEKPEAPPAEKPAEAPVEEAKAEPEPAPAPEEPAKEATAEPAEATADKDQQ